MRERSEAASALEPPCCSGRSSSSPSAFTSRAGLKLERRADVRRRGDGLSFDVDVDLSSRRRRRRPSASEPTPSTSYSDTAFASLSIASATARNFSYFKPSDRARGASERTATTPLFASSTFDGKKDDAPSSSTSSPSSAARARNYLLHLAAGACSCAVARTTLAPLERMKLEQVLHGAAGLSVRETAERVWRSGVAAAAPSSASGGDGVALVSDHARRLALGAAAFWRGNGVNLLRTCPHKAVNFFAFDTYRSALLTARRSKGRRERRAAGRERRKESAGAVANAGAAAAKGKRRGERGEVERQRPFPLSLSPRKERNDGDRHRHHHIHGAAPAPTTAHFDYDGSDSDEDDSEVEFGAAERFLAGAMAGATATAICFPLDVLRTRVLLASANATATASSATSLLRSIVAREGFGALYSGLSPALAATGPSGAIFYGTYDILKHLTLRSMERREEQREEEERRREEEEARRRRLSFFGGARRGDAVGGRRKKRKATEEPARMSARATLACGAAAGAAAELAMYPMEVVRRRMQVASMQLARASAAPPAPASLAQLRRATTFRGAAAALLSERGLAGLYAGVGPTMLQVLPSAALSYYAYESFKSKFGVVSGVQ